jgi:hypothetical protein
MQNYVFEMRTKFFLAGWKAQCDDGDRRILLGDNITLGQSCCSPSISSVLEFGFRLDSAAYSYIFGHMFTQFDLRKIQLPRTSDLPESKSGRICKLLCRLTIEANSRDVSDYFNSGNSKSGLKAANHFG